nr:probable alpha,alpha-trehalose-phosphate synthase [UDP-forming] 9 [Tanacetum cinerariifolium]
MGRLESVLNLTITLRKVKEIAERFKGKKIIVGVDDTDIFKGLSLKLLAFEYLLEMYPLLQGKLVLIQIVNPARSNGKDVQEAKRETQHSPYLKENEMTGVEESPRTSMLVVSEFVGCSPSLSGAIRVNPWDIESVAAAINSAIVMKEPEKQLRHAKHYRYVSSHDVGYWARSFMQDLERASKDHYNKRCWGIGFGLGFRVVSLSPGFRKLSEWLSPCERLGLAAEHGCYVSWSKSLDWQPGLMGADLEWKEIAEPVMEL